MKICICGHKKKEHFKKETYSHKYGKCMYALCRCFEFELRKEQN